MKAQEIMKLAWTQKFDIYKLNQIDDKHFILKHMIGDNFPSWEILSQATSFNEVMDTFHKNNNGSKYPLLIWNEFSTFDILELIKNGFRVFRETKTTDNEIEKFDKNRLKWTVFTQFDTIQEKVKYLNFLLSDTKNILIDK